MSSNWQDIDGRVRMLKPSDDSCQVFEITPDGGLTCHGYTADEVPVLLEAYRDHMSLFISLMRDAHAGMDAVRYVPQGPEDVLGEDQR